MLTGSDLPTNEQLDEVDALVDYVSGPLRGGGLNVIRPGSEYQHREPLRDQPLTASGAQVEVVGLDANSRQSSTAYDLSVEDLQSFYVSTGTDDVLVHNSSCPVGNPSDAARRRIPAGTELGKLDAASPNHLNDALNDWTNRQFIIDGEPALLDLGNIRQILQRHHPRFWDPSATRSGQARGLNTAYAGSTTPDQVADLILNVVQVGERSITRSGDLRFVSTINGIQYEVVVSLRTGDSTARHVVHASPLNPSQ